jgi:hypothetical protein
MPGPPSSPKIVLYGPGAVLSVLCCAVAEITIMQQAISGSSFLLRIAASLGNNKKTGGSNKLYQFFQLFEISNIEQGISNDEVLKTATFDIPCSIFDIQIR